jgi:hypothetical protein
MIHSLSETAIRVPSTVMPRNHCSLCALQLSASLYVVYVLHNEEHTDCTSHALLRAVITLDIGWG